MNNLVVLDNPLVKRDITYLRNRETEEYQFRLALRRISFALSIEIAKTFNMKEIEVETPLEKTKGHKINHQIVMVPVLRAGLSMVSAFIEMIPDAKMGHIGLQRDEKTLKPVEYYFKVPSDLHLSKVIVLDPMLATGGSASAALDFLKEKDANDLSLACLISAPEGVEKIYKDHPDVKIYTAVLDRQLNEIGFILPGLGDAGDRTFGTL
ncbi:MAG: uracil phosphoribosyltransferase [Melioribacteraceae bacterium]|nr:uracil phosphoribosyltransferase [Melioribacteraceae bacterium]MCF8355265.1 uracil phosphoribosyltransferase [Melioribacteraceae bacterium]MCF8394164.1 uracil phosphoribosyltransferase [Melioribacteraceae bacterium]MCF8418847.1 uracil phosphoribosyltransferase [Melioribacteraceae bacterium]